MALLSALALRRFVSGEGAGTMAPFDVLPKDQFLAAVGGFLSYRIPLLFTEVGGGGTKRGTKGERERWKEITSKR